MISGQVHRAFRAWFQGPGSRTVRFRRAVAAAERIRQRTKHRPRGRRCKGRGRGWVRRCTLGRRLQEPCPAGCKSAAPCWLGAVGAGQPRPFAAARWPAPAAQHCRADGFFYLEAATRPRCGKPCKPRDLRRWCAGGALVVRWHAASAMPQLGAGPGDKRATDADFGAPQQIGGQWPQPGPAHRRLRARPASDHGVIFGGIFGANFGGIPGISQTACPWPPATRPAPAAARPA